MTDPGTLVTNPDLTAAVVQISSFLSHLSVGGASAHILEWVKGHPVAGKMWALLSKRGKVLIGALMAGAGSLGVTATFAHDPHAQAGVYTVLLTGLTGPSILQHAWSFVQSWLLQQGWYQTVIQPKPVTGAAPAAPIPGVVAVPPVPVPVVVERPVPPYVGTGTGPGSLKGGL
jgi:hypothetical protein